MSKPLLEIPTRNLHQRQSTCGEFIFEMNQRLAKIAELEKVVKEAKEIATNVMLDRLEATGLKNFAFEGVLAHLKRQHQLNYRSLQQRTVVKKQQ